MSEADTHDDAEARRALVAEWVEHLKSKEVALAIPKILSSLADAAREPTGVALPADEIVNLLAELAASGDAHRARTLTEGLRAWVQALPRAHDAFSCEGMTRWVLLDELARAEPELSYPVYVALGRLIAENDASLVELLLRHRETQPERAARDVAVLRASAPTLASTFAPFLEDREPAQSPRQARAARVWLWIVAIAIGANLLRMWVNAQQPLPEHPDAEQRSPE